MSEEIKEELENKEEEIPAEETATLDAPVQPGNAPSAKKAMAILEGLLFIVGDEGLTLEQAANALAIDPTVTRQYLDALIEEYTKDDHGIELTEYGGIYRFLSKNFVHDAAKNLFQLSKQATLSQAALETLAIIAYKQPVTRVEIEEIRGVGADVMLRKLEARDLIREVGRSEAAGRPILYEVTDEFMNSFKIKTLKELPELPEFNEEDKSEDLFQQ